MDEDGFWKIVQSAHDSSGGDMDQKCAALRRQVAALSKKDAPEFARMFDAKMDQAYSWPLWGAAYVINGGCSDDTFTDFRAALISRGRQAFERAIADPDSLADEDFDEGDWFDARLSICGHRWGRSGCRTRLQRSAPGQPSGTEWREDAVYALFPKLSGKFG